MTLTEVPQATEIEAAIELLEECVNRMTAKGWHNGAGYGEKGERCLANTLYDVAIATRKAVGERGIILAPSNKCVWIAQKILDQLVAQQHSCPCDPLRITQELPLPHYNDYHCGGLSDALELYRAAIKELREVGE